MTEPAPARSRTRLSGLLPLGWLFGISVLLFALTSRLEGVPDVLRPQTLEGNEHVWHLYTVRVPARDRVLASLHEDGIDAGVHYPVPIHLQGAFESLGHRRGDFPEAERAANELLSLPIFPGASLSFVA